MLAADSLMINNGQEPYFSPKIYKLLQTILPEGMGLKSQTKLTDQSVTKWLNELTRIQDEQSDINSIKYTVTNAKTLS